MPLIPIKSIIISADRQRREFDAEALMELADSIETNGLLHAPIVRETEFGPVLVAGERRLRAIQLLHDFGTSFSYNNEPIEEGYVPVTTLGMLSPLEAEEAELDENLRRVDLSWQERAEAIARLHSLRSKQAEASTETHTMAKTAEELHGRSDGIYLDSTRKAVIVAAHLANPAVAKCKSVDEAFKTLKREEAAEKNRELAAMVGRTFSSNQHNLIHGEVLDWMRGQSPGQFDVILTDPPYGMDAHKFGDAGGKMVNIDHQYDDTFENFTELLPPFLEQSYRLAKPQAHLYLFCDIDNFVLLKQWAREVGWWVHRTPLIRHIHDGARVPWPEHGPRRAWEMILYAVKGKKMVNEIRPDLITGISMKEPTYGHGAQKPIDLLIELLSRSCRPGDHVFDGFAGTGSIFPAAHHCKVIATGVEMNPEYYGIALKRLGELE